MAKTTRKICPHCNTPEIVWDLIIKQGTALNEVIDALEKLPQDGWSEREHLLKLCRKAMRRER